MRKRRSLREFRAWQRGREDRAKAEREEGPNSVTQFPCPGQRGHMSKKYPPAQESGILPGRAAHCVKFDTMPRPLPAWPNVATADRVPLDTGRIPV